MATVDDAVIARLKKGSETFEILVDCDKALDFRAGKASLGEALVTNHIFKDVKKGDKASEHEPKTVFGTEDESKVAEEIVRHGEVQLTTEHRNRLREGKKKQIISMIHRNAVDSKTGLPHPPQRIELAMQQARVKIDEFRKAEEQLPDIIESLRPIIPIRIETWEMAVKIPAKYAAQSYSVLKRIGKLMRDEWQNDGSLVAMVEIPGGVSEEFESEVNKLTKGEAEIKILKKR